MKISAQKAVLFLHAFPLNSDMYKYQFEALNKEGISYIAVDYPGFGNTPVFDTFQDLRQYTDYIVSKLYEAGIKKVVPVGDSMGGYIMFDMWRRHRKLIEGFVFVSTRAESDTQEQKKVRQATIERVKEEGIDFLIEAMLEVQTSPATKKDDKKMKELECIMRKATKQGIINAITSLANRENNLPILKEIDVPTIVIAGKDDEKVTPPEIVKIIADGIKGSKYQEIENAAHLPPFENPEKFNEILINFLKEIGF
ncbi:alpha/beta fold hydrolase [Hydrogenothermus marinus]|uniref:Pimeloyl-ACP methyl ester carboxylesterase n=1 Tax=Hydrogenothermus marinus TaxID=133270 RepID=A0A3M0BJ72_9AQUI|nr:alpha/beta fold hydrolase [Hydrogenothermus marinus]RMA97251.1 pimeloyl-ACP methyl ester carboxylesterase [Hydrogenothermus marinus]